MTDSPGLPPKGKNQSPQSQNLYNSASPAQASLRSQNINNSLAFHTSEFHPSIIKVVMKPLGLVTKIFIHIQQIYLLLLNH